MAGEQREPNYVREGRLGLGIPWGKKDEAVAQEWRRSRKPKKQPRRGKGEKPKKGPKK